MGSVMLYGYELATFASRHHHFWHPPGSFCDRLLGLLQAWECAYFVGNNTTPCRGSFLSNS